MPVATILIVDDYAPNHRLMSFVLEQSGYAVVSALDGLHALDGIGLAERVRADARFSGVPIIVVTASGKETDEVKATGVGVDTFLTKPVDSEDLTRAVAKLVGRASAADGGSLLRLRPSAA